MDADINNSVLVVVDAQKGFSPLCPDELAVAGALEIVEPINQLLALPWRFKFATQDWHPANHCSFKAQGGLYPPHCVQMTPGAEFLPGLKTEEFQAIFRKGFRPEKDAYSATAEHPGWADSLLTGVHNIFVCGICTNICVYETARGFWMSGHKFVHVIEDASAAIELPAGHSFCLAAVKKENTAIKYVSWKEIIVDK